MSDVYVCMHKHARLGGSGGMLPLEIFHKLDALRLLLRPFWDRSKTIVALYMAPNVLHPIFGCLYNYAFVKASWHRISMKESRTTDGVTDGEIVLYASQKSIKLIRQRCHSKIITSVTRCLQTSMRFQR